MKSIIVAYDKNRAIGSNGALPWEGQLPADMKHFKELTEGTSVVMGRKTFESLPEQFRPLPNRENIVVSLSQTAIEGVLVASSIDDAFRMAENDIMVIGGGQIYRQALTRVNAVYATEIETSIEDADTFFPKLPDNYWEETSRERFEAHGKNRFAYSFVTYWNRHRD